MPGMKMPLCVLVALVVGVPPVQVNEVGLSFNHQTEELPILVTLPISDSTLLLWSKAVAEFRPQWAQSDVPSVVRLMLDPGFAKLPESVPDPPPAAGKSVAESSVT